MIDAVPTGPQSHWSEQSILQVLDTCCDAFTFPMLDNGYVYPAATRLSAFSSPNDWGLVIEVFGFSPRSGVPDICCHTFASRIVNRKPPSEFVTPDAHARFLSTRPHNDAHSVFPFDDVAWQGPDDEEMVNLDANELLLRGQPIPIPKPEDCRMHGVELLEPTRIRVFECCRVLAATHRDAVLATPEERQRMLPEDMVQILQLEEWNHPDVIDDAKRPSGNETFIQLASVLASGDATLYRPSSPPNTHWANWPDGGTL